MPCGQNDPLGEVPSVRRKMHGGRAFAHGRQGAHEGALFSEGVTPIARAHPAARAGDVDGMAAQLARRTSPQEEREHHEDLRVRQLRKGRGADGRLWYVQYIYIYIYIYRQTDR